MEIFSSFPNLVLCKYKVTYITQGNLIGAGREGSRFFFSNLSIFEIVKCFILPFGSLGLQFLLAKKIWKRPPFHHHHSTPWHVSSMPFRFPFHLPVLFYNYYFSEINMLKSCWPIHFQIISPTFQKSLIRCATLKRFAAFAPISFVVQWNVIPNDNIQSFQLSFELHF